jgi:hypothetical protein
MQVNINNDDIIVHDNQGNYDNNDNQNNDQAVQPNVWAAAPAAAKQHWRSK